MLVFTVDSTMEVCVTVKPLAVVVWIDVPTRSTKIVEVDVGSVDVFKTVFVVDRVDMNVWPGNTEVLTRYEV